MPVSNQAGWDEGIGCWGQKAPKLLLLCLPVPLQATPPLFSREPSPAPTSWDLALAFTHIPTFHLSVPRSFFSAPQLLALPHSTKPLPTTPDSSGLHNQGPGEGHLAFRLRVTEGQNLGELGTLAPSRPRMEKNQPPRLRTPPNTPRSSRIPRLLSPPPTPPLPSLC